LVLLERLVIQVPREGAKASRDAAADLKHLPAVAEPLGVRGVRRQLSRPWERDEQVGRLAEALGKQKANVVLLGEPGARNRAAPGRATASRRSSCRTSSAGRCASSARPPPLNSTPAAASSPGSPTCFKS